MGAVKTYNGGNAFTLKPNGMDSRNVNKLLYTPNQVPQTNLQYSYDPLHPSCYDGTSTTLNSLPSNRGGYITLFGGMQNSFTQQGVFELDGVNDYGQIFDDITTQTGYITQEYTMVCWVKAPTWTGAAQYPLQYNTGVRGSRFDRFTSTLFRVVSWGDPNIAGNPQIAQVGTMLVEENQWQLLSISYASGGNPTVGYSLNSTGNMTFITNIGLVQDWTTGGVAAELWGVLNNLSVYWSGGLGEWAIYQTNLTNGRVEEYFNNTKKRYGY